MFGAKLLKSPTLPFADALLAVKGGAASLDVIGPFSDEQRTELWDTLRAAPQLREMRLDGCGVGTAHAGNLVEALKALPALRVLSLRNNGLNSAFTKLLANAGIRELEALDLSGNNIADSGATVLAASMLLWPKLQFLDICNNLISDAGLSNICCIIPFTELHVFALTPMRANITDDGREALARILMGPRLTSRPPAPPPNMYLPDLPGTLSYDSMSLLISILTPGKKSAQETQAAISVSPAYTPIQSLVYGLLYRARIPKEYIQEYMELLVAGGLGSLENLEHITVETLSAGGITKLAHQEELVRAAQEMRFMHRIRTDSRAGWNGISHRYSAHSRYKENT